MIIGRGYVGGSIADIVIRGYSIAAIEELDGYFIHIAQPSGISGTQIRMQAGLSVAQAGETFAQAGNFYPAPSYKFKAKPITSKHTAEYNIDEIEAK